MRANRLRSLRLPLLLALIHSQPGCHSRTAPQRPPNGVALRCRKRRRQPQQADALADAPLGARLGDDLLALSQERWQQLRSGDDPYWRAIGRDALRLDQP